MNKLTMSECSKKKLDEIYLIVYAIKNEVNIKKGEYIEKSDVYTLIGIDMKGYRQFINIYQDRVNNNRYWLDCFESLKSRGLKNILFLSVDDNINFLNIQQRKMKKQLLVNYISYILKKQLPNLKKSLINLKKNIQM